jgi:ribosomal protein S18 acetylase RimI-like enzyme
LSKASDPAGQIDIRRAVTADAGAVARLIEPAFVRFIAPALSTVGQVAFRLYVTNKALRARLGDGAVAWCAVVTGLDGDEQLVGYAELRGRDGAPHGIVHLTLLFTAVDRQSQGIARQLLAAVVAHLSAADPPVTSLTVNASAYALPIYERLGFVRISADTEEGGIVATPMRLDLRHAKPLPAKVACRPQLD